MIGKSMAWGAPMAHTIEPGRAMPIAVWSDWPVPTHSRAASTPTPFVISLTDSTAARRARRGCQSNRRPRQLLALWVPAEGDDPRGSQAAGCDHRTETDCAVSDDVWGKPCDVGFGHK